MLIVMYATGNFEDGFINSMDTQGLLSIYTTILKESGIPKVPLGDWNSMKTGLKATLDGVNHLAVVFV